MTKGTAGLAGEAREAQGSMYMQQALSPPRRYYTTTKGGGDRGIETGGKRTAVGRSLGSACIICLMRNVKFGFASSNDFCVALPAGKRPRRKSERATTRSMPVEKKEQSSKVMTPSE